MDGTRGRQLVYGALALVGLVGTAICNVAWSVDGNSLGRFLDAGFANWAVRSLSIDLLVAGVAAVVFMFAEGWRIGMRRVWVYAALSLVTAIGFTFPLFLLMRERHLAAQAAARA